MQSQDLNHLTIHEIIPPTNQIISDKKSLKELETFPWKSIKIEKLAIMERFSKTPINLKFGIWQNTATFI